MVAYLIISARAVTLVASPPVFTMASAELVSSISVSYTHLGIIGICGWGGMAVNAAAMDTRIKATAAMTMYDMARVNANGYFDSENTADARYAKKQAMNIQRTEDYKNGSYAPVSYTHLPKALNIKDLSQSVHLIPLYDFTQCYPCSAQS